MIKHSYTDFSLCRFCVTGFSLASTCREVICDLRGSRRAKILHTSFTDKHRWKKAYKASADDVGGS